MTLPDAEWRRRSGLKPLLTALDADAGATRFVGGCIRDTLLGIPVSDVDLATRLRPDDVVERLQVAGIKAVPTGIAHGTVTAVSHGMPVEITTLRRDVSTDGRRATVAFTDDWQEDAGRRDFTINALSADPGSGRVFDYFGGLDDLDAGKVRFIGEPLRRIAEDHLRILRFFRFHARFGKGDPDPDGLAACVARANDLMALSRERIAEELLKLLALPGAADTVTLMVSHGILAPVLPEIDEAGALRLHRLVDRERALGTAPDPIRRLAALLPPDPQIARTIAARLRLSKKAAKRLEQGARRDGGPPEDPRQLAYDIGREEAIDRLLLGAREDAGLAAALELLNGWARPSLGLSGGDLIAMGLPAGPIVSSALQAIEREWVRSGFPTGADTILRIARRHVDQLLRSSQ